MTRDIDRELFDAVERGDSRKVKELINAFFIKKLIGRKPDVSAIDDKEDTPLIIAAYKGHRDIVELLLKAGAGVDETDKYGNTVLIEATRMGHADIVRELIHQGADIDAKDRDGYNAFMYAAAYGHIDVVREMIKEGADINAVDKEGNSALTEAMRNDRLEVFKEIIKGGPDLEKHGLTPLLAAVICGDNEKAAEIIKNDPRQAAARDNNGATTLYWAAAYGNSEAVKMLVEEGVDPDLMDIARNTAVLTSVTKGFTGILEILLSAGADVNCRGKLGTTPLMEACRMGDVETVKILMWAGALVNEKDTAGRTPLMITMNCYSLEQRHVDIIRELIKAGANVNTADEDKNTPLTWAARLDYIEIAGILLEEGADRGAKNNRGKSAYDYAKSEKMKSLLAP
ncbi:MAG TPA: hypothetical protein ENN43_04355 [bacterium]|nr:hypothetical protein [bacterium]